MTPTTPSPRRQRIVMAVVSLLLVALAACGGQDPSGDTGSLKLSMTGWDRANGNKTVSFDPDPRESDVVTCSDDVCNYRTFPPGTYRVEVVQGELRASQDFSIEAGKTTEAEISPPPE